MTEQEAIKRLDFLNDALNFNRADSDESSCALQMAIKALEKQMPRSVKLYIGQDMQCPVCNKRLRGYEGMKICYCKFCGQLLER